MRVLWLGSMMVVCLTCWGTPHAFAATAQAHSGASEDEGPLLEVEGSAGKLRATFHARAIGESVGPTPVDAAGASFEAGPVVRTRLRPGLVWSTERTIAPFYLKAEFEADLHEGTVWHEPTLFGEGYPGAEGSDSIVRKAALTLSVGGVLNLTGGYLTSHWGLGLVANDGAHGWTPGSANFTQEVGGDRVLRAMASVIPMRELGLAAAVSYDVIEDDDALLEGDEASQWVAALIYGMGKEDTAGVYLVSRLQESAHGATTYATVVDAMAKTRIDLGDMTLRLEAEAAMITGETTLGPNTTHETHELMSIGGVVRAGLDLKRWGVWLDAVYASGDQNLDDGSINGFKSDPNFQQGMILQPYVLAAQSARAPHTASNPDLVGIPSEDLERVPTRGALTNIVSVFPRVWWRPMERVELYGGALVALSPAKLADPLETRLAGGVPTNALGGQPGHLLGTELDLGLRWTAQQSGLGVSLGIEGGVFLPGDAFDDSEGQPMDPVSGTRIILSGRL